MISLKIYKSSLRLSQNRFEICTKGITKFKAALNGLESKVDGPIAASYAAKDNEVGILMTLGDALLAGDKGLLTRLGGLTMTALQGAGKGGISNCRR